MSAEVLAVLAGLLAFAVAYGVTRYCCRPDAALYFVDQPNERSLHSRPTPRTGGVGVMAGVMAAGGLLAALDALPPGGLAALAGALVLALLGLADDRRGLRARVRFLAQVLVAVGFVVAIAGLPSGWGAWFAGGILVLGVVWMSNLYNFMDGSDGLAGGMAVFGFGACALAAGLGGNGAMAVLCLAIAAAAAAFLCFNFHPARIFMGDSGSVPLGFLGASLGLAGGLAGYWPWCFPVLVFSPFIVDATTTLLRRAWRGERVWEAHRSHFYQRLVQMGVGHRRTALGAYCLMAGCGLSAVGIVQASFSMQCFVITMWVFLYLFMGFRIDRAWRRYVETGS